ncbi:hypothetical protein NQ318_007463 [Aromia moschata]|uniref:DH domain-containing protein n=1 Tax=Aromia moschata TaxID=1265417 RepID=A0AAV8YNN0_9CUCU|nr:hypothetical protein NQ318_007463 [Aromia moschata]
MLSKPFRRLDKYSGMLQELERHVEECHPDRGDTQRSVSIYKDIATTCSATRRQKELELQVLTGPVRGWEGPSLTTLGKIILSGLTVNRLEDNEQYKNAFKISAPMIDKRVAVCQSREEADHWVELLRKQMPRSSTASTISQKVAPSQAQFVRSHLHILNSKIITLISDTIPRIPPENYPSAAPYAALTKLFHKLIKAKVLTRNLLKKLLYSEHLNKLNLALVKIRHHRTEISIMTRDIHCRDSVINCDSDSESDTSDNSDGNIKRQDAVDTSSSDGGSSSSSNPFGYIRYYNPKTGSEREQTIYESFIDYGEPTSSSASLRVAPDEPKKTSVLMVSTANVRLNKQFSEESDASSSLPEPKQYMACENLVNLSDSMEINTLHVPDQYVPTTRQSCPTKLVGNKFNKSSLTTIYIPSWSNNDNVICKSRSNDGIAKRESEPSPNDSSCSTATHSSSLELPVNALPLPDRMVAELLYNFDGEFSKSESVESDVTEHSSKTVIKPPAMFQGAAREDVNVSPQTLSLNLGHEAKQYSDKPAGSQEERRSEALHQLPVRPDVESHGHATTVLLQVLHGVLSQPPVFGLGDGGELHPELPDLANSNDLPSCSAQERCSVDMANLFRKYNNLAHFDESTRNMISLSEIEARDFESQCPCTSPSAPPRGHRVKIALRRIIDIEPKPWGSQPKLHSKVFIQPKVVSPPKDWDTGLQKSRSASCLLEDANNQELERTEEEIPLIYKSGLYAHWWLKAKIPASVVKGIYQDTRSPTTGKGMC